MGGKAGVGTEEICLQGSTKSGVEPLAGCMKERAIGRDSGSVERT
jgi:hypothetical protein